MSIESDSADAVVVGAGPAGLVAAVYLGRFRRRCLVVHDDRSRARWIPTSHNIPGFLAGIGGEAFLESLRKQAVRYGAKLHPGRVSTLTVSDGIFALQTEQEVLHSRYVILATGVRDHLPAIEGVIDAIRGGILRVCPICDAYEAIDKRIAVIGDGALGEREAEYLTGYSQEVTLLQIRAPGPDVSATSACVECVPIQLRDLRIEDGRVILHTARGDRMFDVAYLALGCTAQQELATSLSARVDNSGALQVDGHQETTVAGLYAAGDVVRGLNQVVIAAAEGAIAATHIHNRLRRA